MEFAACRSLAQVARHSVQRLNPAGAEWALDEIAGRLTELSGLGAGTQLTLAFWQVLDAQQRREPVVWIADGPNAFFPPDAAANGVDLDSLPVIFAPGTRAAARAADRLIRSGAFGLLVLDLKVSVELPLVVQTRLAGLAKKHDTAVLCLTCKTGDAPSLGSLVSLRCEAGRREGETGKLTCWMRAIKDKRRGPGWTYAEECVGPAGLY